MKHLTDLQGRVALVTGASRGIGQAIALFLAQAGATVIGTATSELGAHGIGAQLQDFNGVGRVLDVTNAEQALALVASVSAEFGAVDILVNNAGITNDGLLVRMGEEQWHGVIDTNLTAVYRLSKACLKNMMKARAGRIINITSVVGVMGNAGQTNYAASKAGVIGFTKSLAKEVGARGITVNAVAPGYIHTQMTDATLNDADTHALCTHIPLGEIGTPDDVAAAVLYLASAMGRYVTGEVMNVNGGLHC